jgi:UDP-N-acetylglucosamine 2-epimerase
MHRRIPQRASARNVITLLNGTMIAQAIPITVSPNLTRLYTLRDENEWVETVEARWNQLVGGNENAIIQVVRNTKELVSSQTVICGDRLAA